MPRRGIKWIYNLRYRSIARCQRIKKRAGSHLRIKKQQGRQMAARRCFNDLPFRKSGAGEGARTLDPDLGKVVLYH
jgi:hypothetical protein